MQGCKLVLAAAVLAMFGGAGTAQADPPAIVVSGGETQEAFDYTAAIRCISEQRMVFFVLSGPSADTTARYLDVLYGHF